MNKKNIILFLTIIFEMSGGVGIINGYEICHRFFS